MASFTKTTGGETPLIHVDAKKKLSKVNPNTYGGFTEHMGRCIYGGIYEPSHPSADENGFRKDVIEALREIDVPVIRYPGGNFVATYHWQEGIGPREKRPARPELAWLGVESNQFGTDDFMKWLEVLSEGKEQRVEPYICLNFGTGTLDEALAWLEYCNGTRDTYWANQRRANGHPEPYNVKYWALGNEVWGPWQVLQMTKEDYAKQAIQWAKALRLMDPSIELILCGENGLSSWDHYVLHEAVEWVDMHSIHIYTASPDHNKNVTAPLSAERAIEITASLIDLARIEKGPAVASKPPVTICFDEWNVWDPERAPGDKGAEEKYTLSDALAVAVWLNVFIRQSKYIGMANIAQTVNVISPLMTTEKGVVRQSTWWPLFLFSKYMRGHTLATHVRGPAYEGETSPKWLQGTAAATNGGISWLDVSATIEADGLVSLAVVNMNDTEDYSVELDGIAADVNVYRVSGDSVQATNVEGSEAVGLHESKWDGKGAFTFPKHSFVMLRYKA
ncbi:alpha-L-arabinofuranosidase [Microdochium nivale]|nr:alpha-L-arabinofuranosidase [Microdochium nivale]